MVFLVKPAMPIRILWSKYKYLNDVANKKKHQTRRRLFLFWNLNDLPDWQHFFQLNHYIVTKNELNTTDNLRELSKSAIEAVVSRHRFSQYKQTCSFIWPRSQRDTASGRGIRQTAFVLLQTTCSGYRVSFLWVKYSYV